MSVPPDYLEYPRRRRGLDHDWFDHRNLFDHKPVRWPSGRPVALWITVHAEFFPLDMAGGPFRPIGGLERPYPDYANFTMRDYGSRVGIFRLMRVLDRLGLPASVPMNSDLARRYPRLVEEVVRRDWEVMASGINMGSLHHGGLEREVEAALIAESFSTLRAATGQPVRGWHSPGHWESMNTIALVAAEGASYVADWINDDLPYPMRTPSGEIHSMPLTNEWADRTLLVQFHQSTNDYESNVRAAFRTLLAEAADHGGRILSIAVHPWVMGQAHRIGAFERVLTGLLDSGAVWPATGIDILDAYKAA
jgi:peptidoglycan/xylan/chitin deacetylase (PgdA/CDA1 family)